VRTPSHLAPHHGWSFLFAARPVLSKPQNSPNLGVTKCRASASALTESAAMLCSTWLCALTRRACSVTQKCVAHTSYPASEPCWAAPAACQARTKRTDNGQLLLSSSSGKTCREFVVNQQAEAHMVKLSWTAIKLPRKCLAFVKAQQIGKFHKQTSGHQRPPPRFIPWKSRSQWINHFGLPRFYGLMQSLYAPASCLRHEISLETFDAKYDFWLSSRSRESGFFTKKANCNGQLSQVHQNLRFSRTHIV
jgi:hypothetical protein